MADLERMKQILASHGIKMSVDGSDEYGGPFVKIEYERAETLEVGAFDMFLDEEAPVPRSVRIVQLQAYPDCPDCLGTGKSCSSGAICSYCIAVAVKRGLISKEDCVVQLAPAWVA